MWDGDKSIQKAGDNSQQLQAQTIIINQGIDEKRAREIYDEKFELQKSDYTNEALEEALKRVSKLEAKLIPKINDIENGLAAFADPSFQFLLKNVQRAAASTERESDYDLLSELLVERVKNGAKDRNITTGIKLAIDIVENISNEALLGLTAAHSVSYFYPVSGDIFKGLDALNHLFGKIMTGDLPFGDEWLDHLDMLKALRINSVSKKIKIIDFYSLRLGGYVDVGIKKTSKIYTTAVGMLKVVNLAPESFLVEHAFNSDYVRIPVVHRDEIKTLHNRLLVVDSSNKKRYIMKNISDKQQNVVADIYNLYEKNEALKKQNKQLLTSEWDKRANLKALREWWDAIPVGFSLTSSGKVLAHANAQRYDSTLPPLI